jgi:hypothetical protein
MMNKWKTLKWTVFSLASMLLCGYGLFLAPGHQHSFGNWNDPFSVFMGIAVVAAIAAQMVALFLLVRPTKR